MTSVVAGPYVAACALLLIAGARKVVTPRPGATAMAAAGVRVPHAAVVAVGAFEVGTGVAGVAIGGRAALLVAVVYLALGGFALRLLLRAPATPCACLGSSTATVSRAHVIVNAAAVGVAAAAAAATGGSPVALFAHRPVAGAVFVALVACCVQLLALALDALPVLAATVKERVS
jgi:hypothetical protein